MLVISPTSVGSGVDLERGMSVATNSGVRSLSGDRSLAAEVSREGANTLRGGGLPLIDVLPSGVLHVGADGRIRSANPRAAIVLGRRDERLEGLDVADLLLPLHELVRAESGGQDEHRTSVERVLADGRRQTLGFQSAAVPEEHGGGFVVVFQDITSLRALRAERDRLLQIAAVGEVLPAILHELKNPLAAVRTTVELLVEEATEGSSLQTDLHAVLHEIRRLVLTLDGVGRFRQELRSSRPAPIDHAIREATLLLEPQAKARGVRLECRVPDLPLLQLDTSAVRAVVFNLVTNATHACAPGQRIEVRAGLLDDGRSFQLVVEDDGCGMSPDVLARCRELFFTTKPRGTGIGLALCSTLADSAGGTLHVSSMHLHGTTVTLSVPLDAPPRREA